MHYTTADLLLRFSLQDADETDSAAYKEWNEEIFFGSKDRKFTRTISSQQSREQRIHGGSTFF